MALLHARLRPGMKVVIAIDDISVPLPSMRRPDAREQVLTVVLEILADHGVEDVEIIIATSVHRRMTAAEVRHVVIVDQGQRSHHRFLRVDAFGQQRFANQIADRLASILIPPLGNEAIKLVQEVLFQGNAGTNEL